MIVYIQDNLQICDKSLHKTPEGYLTLQGIISRSGTMEYRAHELGITDKEPNSIIILDRPKSEVVDPMSVASFMLKPITDNHPNCGKVDINNYKMASRGMVTNVEATADGNLKSDLLITDSELIKAVEAGKRQLSAGYTSEIELSDNGSYGVQRKIRGNHVAFVDKARGGHTCSIIDTSKQQQEITPMAKLKINDVEIEIQDSAVPMVQSLILDVKTLKEKVTVLTDKESSLQGSLDASVEKVKELESSNINDAELIKMAEGMAALWVDVKMIDKAYDYKGKSSDTIKKEIVITKIGDAMKDKSAPYIAARFDVLVDNAKAKANDPLSFSLKDGMHGTGGEQNPDNAVALARQRKIDRNKSMHINKSNQQSEK